MNRLNTFSIFGILFLSSILLGNGIYSNSLSLFAQENEAEIEADIEQENKCKKDTECENENEINNQLNITNNGTQTQEEISLTVKKEVFGCNNIEGEENIDCQELDNDSSSWLSCDDPSISGSIFCQNLSEELFDIEVLDDQNTPIQQFEGSAQGTTIGNIEKGTYLVNEIKHQSSIGQLGDEPTATQSCQSHGFADGGDLVLSNIDPSIIYIICIEYEDEQGNDCSQTTLNDEDKVCTVKNHILFASTVENT